MSNPTPAPKNVSEWTTDELRAKSKDELFIIAAALIAVGHMRDIELQRAHKDHAMAQLNYWGRVHHEASAALVEAQRLNHEGNK